MRDEGRTAARSSYARFSNRPFKVKRRHFALDLAPGQSVWPVINFTLRPRDCLRMTVTGRPLRAESRAAE